MASVTLAMREFLMWVAERPRTYLEAMDAWKTSCPRLTVWEDALHDDLIQLEAACAGTPAGVVLTEAGRAALEEAS